MVEETLTSMEIPISEGTRIVVGTPTVMETPTNEETGKGLDLEGQAISLGCLDTIVTVEIETSQEVEERIERGL